MGRGGARGRRPAAPAPRAPALDVVDGADDGPLFIALESRGNTFRRALELRAPWITPEQREVVGWALIRRASGHIDTTRSAVCLWCGHRRTAAEALAAAGFERRRENGQVVYVAARPLPTAAEIAAHDAAIAHAREVLAATRWAQEREAREALEAGAARGAEGDNATRGDRPSA